ncbi:hypothetical protein G9A89_012590 [Geosiphon pyriformis]|nr:hypothetical protein G9A89_012590 [Geosiphon pyriformis]
MSHILFALKNIFGIIDLQPFPISVYIHFTKNLARIRGKTNVWKQDEKLEIGTVKNLLGINKCNQSNSSSFGLINTITESMSDRPSEETSREHLKPRISEIFKRFGQKSQREVSPTTPRRSTDSATISPSLPESQYQSGTSSPIKETLPPIAQPSSSESSKEQSKMKESTPSQTTPEEQVSPENIPIPPTPVSTKVSPKNDTWAPEEAFSLPTEISQDTEPAAAPEIQRSASITHEGIGEGSPRATPIPSSLTGHTLGQHDTSPTPVSPLSSKGALETMVKPLAKSIVQIIPPLPRADGKNYNLSSSIDNIKNAWAKFWPIRWLGIITMTFTSVPVIVLIGWIIITLGIILGIAGIGIGIAEAVTIGVGGIVLLPVMGVLTLIAFIGACITGSGYLAFGVFSYFLSLIGYGGKISLKDREALRLGSMKSAKRAEKRRAG